MNNQFICPHCGAKNGIFCEYSTKGWVSETYDAYGNFIEDDFTHEYDIDDFDSFSCLCCNCRKEVSKEWKEWENLEKKQK